MVKAKFGALALTVLMGLGAVSPLHGVTEAHALNAPVANSAQQKTVVSTTDDSDGVMSYKDKENGKTRNSRNQRGLFRVDAGNDRPVHCRI